MAYISHITFSKEVMKDEAFVKEYEAIQPEMNVIRAIGDASTSQNVIM